MPAAISACQTARVPGRTGVWTLPGAGGNQKGVQEKKIAAIGVHIARGITSHGFAFNVHPDLRDFDLIVPCGITDRAVTSLELEADPAPAMDAVRNAVARQFGHVFQHQVLWVESLADLLPEPALAVEGAVPQPDL